ncbi:hypothetical protein FB45DRAFT_941543 [Roridomyces roridus]|uniref:Beta-cyclopiazonate dehydrogenase n=1 Tax=Roridomyces roridus TaxID=1738132 RepID=A0AAD7B5L6_9AGAR|nr:hypothetical protein FB45DRAFT_946840 [Roridomyces roridus]KAJ7611323.1 hypothetical protein FB45DRAFT_941543 [Roridomyces roridus]
MLFPLLTSSFFLLAQAHPKPQTTISRDVVVIGGGSSGTYASVNLHARGHSVAVLERQGRLGGHVETYHDPDTGAPHNLGVILYYNNTLNTDYFSLLGVPVGPAAQGGAANTWLDFNMGKPAPGFDGAADSAAAFGPVLTEYLTYIGEKYPYLSLSYENLTYPIPAELLEPFTVFAEKHNFTALLHTFDQFSQNIGNLWTLPTYQAIHAFENKIVAALSQGFVNPLSGDNQDIYNAAARYLGAENVFLNSTITGVDRSGACFGFHPPSPVCVLSTTGSNTTLVQARKLLVAIPNTLDSLHAASLDLDAQEHSVFSQFTAFTYGVTVVNAPHLPSNTSYTNVGTNTPFHLLTLPGAFSFQPLSGSRFASWFGAIEPSGWTDERIKKLITAEVLKVGGGNASEISFDFLKNHAPFRLHVSPQAVARGFYKDLYALEGRKNTFWTGAAWAEQDSSQIWLWSEESLLPRMEKALA